MPLGRQWAIRANPEAGSADVAHPPAKGLKRHSRTTRAYECVAAGNCRPRRGVESIGDVVGANCSPGGPRLGSGCDGSTRRVARRVCERARNRRSRWAQWRVRRITGLLQARARTAQALHPLGRAGAARSGSNRLPLLLLPSCAMGTTARPRLPHVCRRACAGRSHQHEDPLGAQPKRREVTPTRKKARPLGLVFPGR
jgi:hypothetical protein